MQGFVEFRAGHWVNLAAVESVRFNGCAGQHSRAVIVLTGSEGEYEASGFYVGELIRALEAQDARAVPAPAGYLLLMAYEAHGDDAEPVWIEASPVVAFVVNPRQGEYALVAVNDRGEQSGGDESAIERPDGVVVNADREWPTRDAWVQFSRERFARLARGAADDRQAA